MNWTVAGKVVSDKAEYKFKVDRAAELQANFVKSVRRSETGESEG